MGSISLLNSPLLVGFEDLEKVIDKLARNYSDNYPPYNIEQLDPFSFRVSVAVAGFKREQLEVGVEDNCLVVRAAQKSKEETSTYLHRGIATRQFLRTFLLAEGLEVINAQLLDGILHINIVKPQKARNVKTIAIEYHDRHNSSHNTHHDGDHDVHNNRHNNDTHAEIKNNNLKAIDIRNV